MSRKSYFFALVGLMAMVLSAVGCGPDASPSAERIAAATQSRSPAPVDTGGEMSRAGAAFTAAELEAYIKGIAREVQAVHTAR